MHLNFIDGLQSVLEASRIEEEFTNFLAPFFLTAPQAESETTKNFQLHVWRKNAKKKLNALEELIRKQIKEEEKKVAANPNYIKECHQREMNYIEQQEKKKQR